MSTSAALPTWGGTQRKIAPTRPGPRRGSVRSANSFWEGGMSMV